ncbi:GDP-mannose 4,6-dehydratase [Brevundimonas sp. P7753]|uniref:NAD-dependent epimerase/dehydratase family protein n=1 Tax=Brevundimonas sp. P7753 TaxID=2726982 RepID=UPI0015BC8458|nr:GDP-mannose 4,6-dehydratase [Brevundimonas sp. P7753]NWE51246.1 GDP-mannose 4,6-dehydratase [Brevundimonas sp. P7753]
MDRDARVLVTGAGGFVGMRLVKALSADLRVARILALGGAGETGSDKVESADVDVTTDELEAATARFLPTHVVHLAAISSVAASLQDRRGVMDVAALGALHLADAIACHAPAARVLFTSSAEVYGRAFASGVELDESSPVSPANPYARSKLASEFLLADRLPSSASLIIMRPLNHIGPGQDTRFVVSAFARQIAEIEYGVCDPVISVGNLDAQRDFLSVVDVIDAYVRGLFLPAAPGSQETFNVSAGAVRSIRSVLDDLLALSSVQCQVKVDPARLRPSDVPVTRLSSEKLRAATEWSPSGHWDVLLASILDDQRRAVGEA